MASRRRMQVAGAIVLSMALAGEAWGGSFVVNPIRVNLSAAQRVSALTVRNDAAESVVIQFDAVAWSQENGKDVYVQTKDVLATPPVFTVPAGGTQTLRVGLRSTQDARHELAYRLFLQELPGPPKPGFIGAQMALRLSVPLFVKPETDSGIKAEWHVQAASPGMLKVSLRNDGSHHLQIANLALSSAAGAAPVRRLGDYVLPGQTRAWIVDGNAAVGSTVRLSAKSDAGPLEAEVTVGSD